MNSNKRQNQGGNAILTCWLIAVVALLVTTTTTSSSMVVVVVVAADEPFSSVISSLPNKNNHHNKNLRRMMLLAKQTLSDDNHDANREEEEAKEHFDEDDDNDVEQVLFDELEEILLEEVDEENENQSLEEEFESFLKDEEEDEEDSNHIIQLDVLVDTSGEMGNLIGESMTGQILKWMMEEKVMTEPDMPRIELNVRYITPNQYVRKSSQQVLERCMSSAFLSSEGTSLLSDVPCLSDYQKKSLHFYIQNRINEQTQMINDLFQEEEEDEEENVSSAVEQLPLLTILRDESSSGSANTDDDEFNPEEQLETFQNLIDSLVKVTRGMIKNNIPMVESDRHQSVEDVNPQNDQMEQFPLLSFPFLFVQAMTEFTFTVDHFYDRIRDHYVWNDQDPRCCSTDPDYMPKPNETVLHARGFRQEIKTHNAERNINEMNPHRTATELLGYLSPKHHDEVAIISRFDSNYMKPFVDELQKRNIPARSMDEENLEDKLVGPAHDFCFLKSATRGVAGSYRSTFLQWAIVLSDSIEHAQLYVYSSNNWKQHVNPNLLQPIQISPQYKQKHVQIMIVDPKASDLKWEE